MKITNAKIKNVTVDIDDRDRLTARMTFASMDGCDDWSFVLSNPTDVQRLKTLMNYVGVSTVANLEGKIIRKVVSEGYFRGFGHPIEDKFITHIMVEFMEISEKSFEELLKE